MQERPVAISPFLWAFGTDTKLCTCATTLPYCHFGPVHFLLWRLLYIVGYFTPSLASVHQIPLSPPPSTCNKSKYLQTLPNVSWGAKVHRVGSHWSIKKYWPSPTITELQRVSIQCMETVGIAYVVLLQKGNFISKHFISMSSTQGIDFSEGLTPGYT